MIDKEDIRARLTYDIIERWPHSPLAKDVAALLDALDERDRQRETDLMAMPFGSLMKMRRVIDEVEDERLRQHHKWGEQNWSDGTGAPWHRDEARTAKAACSYAVEHGQVSWRHILREEVAEAFAESDRERLRAELVQVAAVAVAWVEAIDRRQQ